MIETRRKFLAVAGIALVTHSRLLATSTAESDPVSQIRASEYGMHGDARHGQQGWYGNDDGPKLNQAISQLAAQGGGDLIISQKHFVSSSVSEVQLGGQGISARSLGYAIRLRPNVRVRFEGGGGIYNNPAGSINENKLACFGVDKSDGQFPVRLEGGTVAGFFVGIVCTEDTAVDWIISDFTFKLCSIAILIRTAEQCSFRDIYLLQCSSGIVTGGFYRFVDNAYSESGGFSDKCLFSNIRSVADCKLDRHADVIDNWYDENIFMSANNPLFGKPEPTGPARSFPYTGIAGYAVRMMARYARPNNSNVFDILSHANAPRGAIWIDSGRSNLAQSIYAENLGYADWRNRESSIGGIAVDRYLGKGNPLPYIIKGVSMVGAVNVQHCVARSVSDSLHTGFVDSSSSTIFGNTSKFR